MGVRTRRVNTTSNIRVDLPRFDRQRGSGNIPKRIPLMNRRTGGGTAYVDIDFRWHGDRVQKDIDEAAIDAMGQAIQFAVDLTQQQGWTPVRTGNLKRSIKSLGIIAKERQITGWFGSELHYALYQELGTSRFGGRFYLTRAGTLAAKSLEPFVTQYLKQRGY